VVRERVLEDAPHLVDQLERHADEEGDGGHPEADLFDQTERQHAGVGLRQAGGQEPVGRREGGLVDALRSPLDVEEVTDALVEIAEAEVVEAPPPRSVGGIGPCAG